MTERIRELADRAGEYADFESGLCTDEFLEKFAELIVYDFLGELTNDDSLGEARIATIRRLAEKWGVAR